jgi:hypothetical protein
MAADEALNRGDPESTLVWAPIHAWRALGQLRAEAAIEPLLTLVERSEEWDDDWGLSELPEVLGEIGAAAIEPAANYLAEANHNEWARITAAEALGKIGGRHPEVRSECVAKLAAQLEKFTEQSEALNAFLIMPLLDMRALEVTPLMEQVYAAGRVDETIVGNWEDAQVELGLLERPVDLASSSELIPPSAMMDEIRETILEIGRENPKVRAIMEEAEYGPVAEPYVAPPKVGRNEPCPCGSGKKYKKCCGV